jgi:riboflavin kinase/FMN adenylyltransferase
MLVATIGNFDGVHLGHRALVDAARHAAGGGRVVAVTFDPLPAAVLRPDAAPARLTPCEVRSALLHDAGCDEVRVIDPRGGLLAESPAEFVAALRAGLPFDAVVEGGDFRFGRGRVGDVGTLRGLGASAGFRVVEVEDVVAPLADGTVVATRSSAIRWMLAMGRVADAARLLGRAHAVRGTVAPGDRRGRLLGFPTANVSGPDAVLPADGVYGGRALADGREWPAAISVGVKPTFGGAARTCEVHVVGAQLPLDRYGWEIEVRFDRWIRGQWRFPGPDALVARLRADVALAAALA